MGSIRRYRQGDEPTKNLSGKSTRVNHELEPIFHQNSEILILGSIPSVKSREEKFYYAHPQNKFWKILAEVYNEKTPSTIKEKQEFLERKHLALWDVIKSCTITGSSDSSIKEVIPNNINNIIDKSNIRKIYTTGKTAYHLYNKYIYETTKIEAIYLPSTSPANASISYQKILEAYKQIKE